MAGPRDFRRRASFRGHGDHALEEQHVQGRVDVFAVVLEGADASSRARVRGIIRRQPPPDSQYDPSWLGVLCCSDSSQPCAVHPCLPLLYFPCCPHIRRPGAPVLVSPRVSKRTGGGEKKLMHLNPGFCSRRRLGDGDSLRAHLFHLADCGCNRGVHARYLLYSVPLRRSWNVRKHRLQSPSWGIRNCVLE